MTKKQYLQPESLVSEVKMHGMILAGSDILPDPESLGIGGGGDIGGAI